MSVSVFQRYASHTSTRRTSLPGGFEGEAYPSNDKHEFIHPSLLGKKEPGKYENTNRSIFKTVTHSLLSDITFS